MVRTGSLQLSGSTSVGTSSLKRTKRKAPAPPSKPSLTETDEGSSAAAHGILLGAGQWLGVCVLVQSVKTVGVMTCLFPLI